jgi:hypothetical protein
MALFLESWILFEIFSFLIVHKSLHMVWISNLRVFVVSYNVSANRNASAVCLFHQSLVLLVSDF